MSKHLMRTILLTSLTIIISRLLDTPNILRSISAFIKYRIQPCGGYVAVVLQSRNLFVPHVAEQGESEGHADDYAEGYA